MSRKPWLVEVVAHRARHGVAQPQALLHDVAAQVDVAVLEADLPRALPRRAGTGSGSARFSTSSLASEQLDRAGREVRVGRARRPRAHECRRRVMTHSPRRRSASANTPAADRVEHDLQQALAVAQVDEDHAAVVAAAMHPAGDGHTLADEGFVDVAAVMSTHRHLERGWLVRRPVAGGHEKRRDVTGRPRTVQGGGRRAGPSIGAPRRPA